MSTQQVSYKVEAVRESLIGDKIDAPGLQALLNEHAQQGWLLKTTVKASVKGRIGPGGTGGLILIFERHV